MTVVKIKDLIDGVTIIIMGCKNNYTLIIKEDMKHEKRKKRNCDNDS